MKKSLIAIVYILAGLGMYFVGKNVGAKLFTTTNKETIIGKPNVTVLNGQMTPEILWSFGRIGEFAVSPDASTIAYTVTYFDLKENKGNAEIYLMDADGGNVRQLTHTDASERNLVWSNDGKKLYCLYQGQIHEINLRNGKLTKISDFSRSIESFLLSPDQSKVLYVQTVARPKLQTHLFDHLPKSSGRIIEDLHYRHWDQFVDNDPQIFVSDFNTKISDGKNLLEHTPYQAPMRPFGGLEQIDWSPCGTKIAYTSKKKVGKEWAFSTDSDIYIYDLNAETVYNISEGNMGYDKNPTFSPDGSMIAWESMERDGYESDQKRLFTYNFETSEKIYRTKNYDFDVQNLLWSKDGNEIYFIKPWHGRQNIHKINLTTNLITQISNENADFNSLNWLGENLIASQTTLSRPTEIFSVDLNGQSTQISQVNTELLSQLNFGKVEERWIKTRPDNQDMLVWVVYPINFDENKKYPALLFCGGGPQNMISQFWSYRWNPQLMAANDYVVVLPNRRGVPGFGKVWNEQISGDYGGQNKRDLMHAIDVIAKEPFVDETRLGATGASYGGFSIYWLAGHNDNNHRFKAFLAHNGIFNFEQMYLETEEMFFINWDYGGPYWDKNNKIAQRTYANSPHLFITRWNTPICVVHCELDYRVPISQGMAAFNAAQMMGIPSRFLYFPDENHWVLKPQNSVLWHRNFFDWFDQYLK
jgi:dipeptidyl aminopeptidase/acylaminoacyl peptidase